MKLPLAVKIKKKAHQDIAAAQDLVLEELYHFFPRAVLHGGTAVWRCYGGNRFSEDLDVYLPGKEALAAFFPHLQQKGFRVQKKRIKDNSLYSVLEFNRVQVRLEAIFGQKKSIVKEYEQIDGNYLAVYTLSAEDLLQEKIAACLKRKKVRDLYDIFFLLRYSKTKPENLDKIEKIDITDAENLPSLVLSGVIPSVNDMKEYIATWEP